MAASKKHKQPSYSLMRSYASLPWWWHALSCPAIYLILKYSFFRMYQGLSVTSTEYAVYTYAPIILALCPLPLMCYGVYRKYKKNKWFQQQSSIYDIRRLSWQQFEVLIAAAFEKLGYSSDVLGGGGADGGKDIYLRKKGRRVLAQCKHWKSTSVGAPVIREMYGLMVAEKFDAVMVVTSGKFTKEAMLFAKGKPIVLINGAALVKLLAGIRKKQAK